MFRLSEKSSVLPIITKKSILPSIKFDCQNKDHLLLIENQIIAFNQSLNALQLYDQQILKGLALGVASWLGTYVFPLVSISIISFCYSTHLVTKRSNLQINYAQSLNNLLEVYNWCMGEKSAAHFYELRVEMIQNLIQTLSPWLSTEMIVKWNEQDRKPGILGIYALTPEFQQVLDTVQLGQQSSSWSYKLYSKKAVDAMEDFSIAEMGKLGIEQVSPMIMQAVLNYRPK